MHYRIDRKARSWVFAILFLAVSASFSVFSDPTAFAATTSCDTIAACVLQENSKGPGIEGQSTGSFGLIGDTFVNSDSLNTARAGVLGQDKSTNKGSFNTGVAGVSQYGIGMLGEGGVYGGYFTATANNGNGLYASSINGVGIVSVSNTSYGITGTTSSSSNSYIAGIAGYDDGSTTATSGVEGFSTAGRGVSGFSASGFGLYSQSNNIGLVTFSGGDGVYAESTGTSNVAIRAIASYGLFVGTNKATSQNVVSIDNSGNEILAGTLTQSGQPEIRTQTSSGRLLAAYSARTSQPTLEDFGEAELSKGRSRVNLDPTYASTIDPRERYMVFLTPHGDNHGLYVTSISHDGFSVIESGGGRSTLSFDYRIVAKPYDSNAPRLPATTAFSGLGHSRLLQRAPIGDAIMRPPARP